MKVVAVEWLHLQASHCDLFLATVTSSRAHARGAISPAKWGCYAAAFNRKILQAEKTSNLQAQSKLDVDKKKINKNVRCQWQNQQNELFNWPAKQMAFTRPQKGQHHEVKKDVANFIRRKREGWVLITTEIIQAKVKEVSNVRGVARTQFKASRDWVRRFVKRFEFDMPKSP